MPRLINGATRCELLRHLSFHLSSLQQQLPLNFNYTSAQDGSLTHGPRPHGPRPHGPRPHGPRHAGHGRRRSQVQHERTLLSPRPHDTRHMLTGVWQMLFTWDTTDLCIVFPSWHISGTTSLIFSLLAIILLTAGYEAIREVSRRYETYSKSVMEGPRGESTPSL
jgi:hypothetical protein